MNSKTYTRAELAEILEKHEKWLRVEDGGERAVLAHADLAHADLAHTDLTYADLRGTNLTGADLAHTKLSYAHLRGTILSYADLRGTDLTGVSSFWGAVGNCSQIKSLQVDTWPVVYTATHMQIGCRLHTLEEWWKFSDEEIRQMDDKALAWWRIWKPILRMIIETSPAKVG